MTGRGDTRSFRELLRDLGLNDDPYVVLQLTLIVQARRDALSGKPHLADDALTYFFGPNFAADCAALGLDVEYTRGLLLQGLGAREDGNLSPEAIHRLHAEYVAEDITLDALARRYAASGPTLSRLFQAANLPVRPPGRPRRPAQSAHQEAHP